MRWSNAVGRPAGCRPWLTQLAPVATAVQPALMADERLQQLRRAWDEGDLEVQVRVLRERMRAGELSEERVRLAALCGSGVGAEVTGHDCNNSMAPCFRCWSELSVLNRIQELGGAVASVRAAIAGSRLHWKRIWEGAEWERLRVRSWRTRELNPPGAVLDWAELNELVGAAIFAAEALAAAGLGCQPPTAGSRARVQLNAWSVGTGFDLRWSTLPLELALEPPERSEDCPNWKCLSYHVSREDLLKAVRDELVPWTLGLRDPVAERVAAREVRIE